MSRGIWGRVIALITALELPWREREWIAARKTIDSHIGQLLTLPSHYLRRQVDQKATSLTFSCPNFAH